MNRNTIAWHELEELLIKLGDALEKPASLVVIGASVCMSLGLPGRMTMDVDVWRKDSTFDLGSLKRACEAVGIAWNPKGFEEPDSVYIQMIDPGIVQLGVFKETESILSTGNLEIRRPPIENVIASKLVRGDARDFDDCAFLIRKCRVGWDKIAVAIRSIDEPVAQENALGNLEVLQLVLDDLKPGANCRQKRSGAPRPRP